MPGTETPPTPSPPDPAAAGDAGHRHWRDWYVLALSLASAVFCLGPSLIGARTLTSVNFLSGYLPWAAAGNRSVGHEGCQSDIVDSGLPAISYIRHQIATGHLGAWQSFASGGGPMSALPNQGLLDPLSLPYWLLPLRLATGFVDLLCWVVAIGGTYLFLRRLSVGRPAATLAGFVFATSGFMVVWTNWPQTRTAALIPALFWATERVAARGRPRDAVLLAAVVASMLLGGFPAVTGYALYAAAGYFVVRTLSLYWRERVALVWRAAAAGGGLVLGALLSAVQMLPFADFYRVNSFAYRSGEAKAGLPAGGLVTAFAPNANGLCTVNRSGAAVVHGPVNPIELVAYVGAAALVLAVVGAAVSLQHPRADRRRATAYFVVAAAVIVTLGWVSPGARSLVASLPVFAGNFIGRIRSLLGLVAAVLAGIGFDWLTRRPRPGTGGRRPLRDHRLRPEGGTAALVWAAVVPAVAVVGGLLAVRSAHRAAFAGHYLPAWHKAVEGPTILLLAAAVVAAVTAVSRRRGVTTVAFVLLPVAVVAQGTYFFHTVMPGDSPAMFYPDNGDHAFLRAHLGHDRFASGGLTLYPGTAYYYGLRSPTGHEFTESRWYDLLRAVSPVVMQSPTNTDFASGLNQVNAGSDRILDEMGVRYVVLPPSDLGGTPQGSPSGTDAVGGSAGPLTCSVPAGPIRGISVRLATPLLPARPPTGETIHIRVALPGRPSIDGGIYFTGGRPADTVTVPVAGEDLPPGGNASVSLWATGTATPLKLAGTASRVSCTAVSPRADGLKLVYSEPGAVIYQRLTAEPRIRWASTAQVGPAGGAAIPALRTLPPASVLLSAPGPAATGGDARVQVTSDDGDRISARVDAQGSGYLVVADPMQLPGWTVTVDGRPARLMDADYAMVAVAVPVGVHTVAFTYHPPGLRAGAVLTAVGVAIAAGVLWCDGPGRLRRGRRSRLPDGNHG